MDEQINPMKIQEIIDKTDQEMNNASIRLIEAKHNFQNQSLRIINQLNTNNTEKQAQIVKLERKIDQIYKEFPEVKKHFEPKDNTGKNSGKPEKQE